MSVSAGAWNVQPAELPAGTHVHAPSPLPGVPPPLANPEYAPTLKCDHPDADPFVHVSTVYVPACAGGAATSNAAAEPTRPRPAGHRCTRMATPRPARRRSR